MDSELGACVLVKNPHQAKVSRLAILGISAKPKGQTLDAKCGSPLCITPSHVCLRPWKNIKGDAAMYAALARQIAELPLDGFVELHDAPYSSAEAVRLTGGVHSTSVGKLLRMAVRALPRGRGLRIIRIGTYATLETEGAVSSTHHPNLASQSRKTRISIGSPWLGQVYPCGDLKSPRLQPCHIKGCVWPATADGLCRWHSDIPESSVAFEAQIDNWDMRTRKTDSCPNPDPLFHTGWLTEDKTNWLRVCREHNGRMVYRSRAEEQNDRWWKENVLDKGIDPGNVVTPKAKPDANEALAPNDSMRNIAAFFSNSKFRGGRHA